MHERVRLDARNVCVMYPEAVSRTLIRRNGLEKAGVLIVSAAREMYADLTDEGCPQKQELGLTDNFRRW